MKIIISNKTALQDVPEGLLVELKSRLSFTNPRWEENDKRGFWNGETPRFLKFYKIADNGSLIIPRGFMRQLIGLCRREDVTFHIEDNRRVLRPAAGKKQAVVYDYVDNKVGVLRASAKSRKRVYR